VVSGSPAWANAVAKCGIPVALQVATRVRVERRQRDRRPRTAAALWRAAMTSVTDRLDDLALRRVDAIQVENPWMLDYAKAMNKGRSVDIRYAPPGIDAALFRPAVDRQFSEGYVLCVGRLGDPRKNPALLAKAYAMLPKELRRRVRLVLAGASSPPPEFWSLVGELGLRDQVTFVERPSMEELVRLYQKAAVFALPSDEEGLGLVVLEAMSCGVPVVCTKCGGPDGIIEDGTDGFLVQALLADEVLNRRMGNCARQTVEERYDERVAGGVFLDVWDSLLQGRSQRGSIHSRHARVPQLPL
jgi:D-inositol-3-phosphate glycosyltransferase